MKVGRIVRWVCMIPLILMLLNAIYCMIFGASFINNVYFGIEGFIYTIIAEIMVLWWVILICLIGFIVSFIIDRRHRIGK